MLANTKHATPPLMGRSTEDIQVTASSCFAALFNRYQDLLEPEGINLSLGEVCKVTCVGEKELSLIAAAGCLHFSGQERFSDLGMAVTYGGSFLNVYDIMEIIIYLRNKDAFQKNTASNLAAAIVHAVATAKEYEMSGREAAHWIGDEQLAYAETDFCMDCISPVCFSEQAYLGFKEAIEKVVIWLSEECSEQFKLALRH